MRKINTYIQYKFEKIDMMEVVEKSPVKFFIIIVALF